MFEFYQVKLTDGSLSSSLHRGTIHVYIRKDGKLIKEWLIRTPVASIKISQTEFVLEVAENGATTLTVLSGEVELSDVSKERTVIVKQNEKSTVRPGGIPSNPEPVDTNEIEKWWEITEATEITETTETTESVPTFMEPLQQNYLWLAAVLALVVVLVVAVFAGKKLLSPKEDRPIPVHEEGYISLFPHSSQ